MALTLPILDSFSPCSACCLFSARGGGVSALPLPPPLSPRTLLLLLLLPLASGGWLQVGLGGGLPARAPQERQCSLVVREPGWVMGGEEGPWPMGGGGAAPPPHPWASLTRMGQEARRPTGWKLIGQGVTK